MGLSSGSHGSELVDDNVDIDGADVPHGCRCIGEGRAVELIHF